METSNMKNGGSEMKFFERANWMRESDPLKDVIDENKQMERKVESNDPFCGRNLLIRVHRFVLEQLASVKMRLKGKPKSESLLEIPDSVFSFDKRYAFILFFSAVLAAISALVAIVLRMLIHLINNICFFGKLSVADIHLNETKLGAWIIPIPIVGALMISLMKKYGSKDVAGHGIPEAMEASLNNDGIIKSRMVLLKPLSGAISIGTGAPYGMEGPIISTGASVGSIIGQMFKTSSRERSLFIAVGGASALSASFTAPCSSTLLALELFLHEYSPQSLIAVSFACFLSSAIKTAIISDVPFFLVTQVNTLPGFLPMILLLCIGGLCGIASALLSTLLYKLEDLWERYCPLPEFFWPLLGAAAVGLIGFFVPRTLGSSYYDFSDIASNQLSPQELALLFTMKATSWVISLSSGTAGGTLAPLLITGSGIGALCASLLNMLLPESQHINITVAALTGGGAFFGGCSRAMLMSVLFPVETTLQTLALSSVIGGCTCSLLMSWIVAKHSIMCEQIRRRGKGFIEEIPFPISQKSLVKDVMQSEVLVLPLNSTIGEAQERINANPFLSQTFFPVTDSNRSIIASLSRADLMNSEREKTIASIISSTNRQNIPIVFPSSNLQEALKQMIFYNLQCIFVVSEVYPYIVEGILTRKQAIQVSDKDFERREKFQECIIKFLSDRSVTVDLPS